MTFILYYTDNHLKRIFNSLKSGTMLKREHHKEFLWFQLEFWYISCNFNKFSWIVTLHVYYTVYFTYICINIHVYMTSAMQWASVVERYRFWICRHYCLRSTLLISFKVSSKINLPMTGSLFSNIYHQTFLLLDYQLLRIQNSSPTSITCSFLFSSQSLS